MPGVDEEQVHPGVSQWSWTRTNGYKMELWESNYTDLFGLSI